MKRRALAVICMLALCTGAHGGLKSSPMLPSAGAAAAESRRPGPPGGSNAAGPAATSPRSRIPSYIDSVPDTGQFLPDSIVLARVNDRVIRVGEYVERFFNSDAQFRPRPDSAGRVDFLNAMINKEILAHVAHQANRRETFEDRAVMREHSQRVLSNVLFKRTVLDSIREPSEEELRKIYSQTGYELRLQAIVTPERARAERVRRDLVRRRLTWRDAVKRYSVLRADSFPDGDQGWRRRLGMGTANATAIFELKPGEISQVLAQPEGFVLYRAAERRPIPLLSYPATRSLIRNELSGTQVAERTERIFALLRARTGMVHDSANIAWVASRFRPAVTMEAGPTPMMTIDAAVPHFEPEDTARVLARWAGGQLTLGGFMEAYTAITPVGRPTITNPNAFHHEVDILALEPQRADLARDLGLERDSLAIALIETRREELLVEHLYQDSILSKGSVTNADRRRLYREKASSFFTIAKVTYAHFHADRKSEADSIAARLRSGEKASDLLRDSVWGEDRGGIAEQGQDEEGTVFYELLFKELRPGEVAIEGPDAQGHFDVIQSLGLDPGRQMSYEEAEAQIDETLRNIEAEKRLGAFLGRHKRSLRIEVHPERLMLVRLLPPS